MACKCKVETYSRVVGYYRPVQQWNKGKQAEFHDRKPFKVSSAVAGDTNTKPEKRPERDDG
ncbi:MAG: hypothetical protein KA763_14315 [Xanthomonadales bacterium]|nr:hypothetical protein [Xanthomonadales bacterium]